MMAFPEKTDTQISSILKGTYKNVLYVIAEFFYMNSLSGAKLNKLIKMDKPGLADKCLERGKGVIIVSAHFGNWELMAYGCAQIMKKSVNIIVKEQTNTRLDKRLNEIRESGGNKMIEMHNSLREVLRLMRENKVVAMLGDQSAPKEGSVKVDFFVKDVPTFEGAARFAIKTGAAVIFGYPVRAADNTYTVYFDEIDMSKYKDYTEENIKALTQEHAKMLEEVIRKYPDHWLWFHRRFKNLK